MKKLVKIKKLNDDGFSHWVIPALIILVIAVIGVRVLTQGHALSPTPNNTPEPPTQLEVKYKDNNHALYVRTGETVVVQLSSLYWPAGSPPKDTSEQSAGPWQNFTSTAPGILRASGMTVYTKQKSAANPGAYNITSTQSYMALARGQTTVSADSIISRVCGPGIDCPLLTYINHFTVTLDVNNSISSQGGNTSCIAKPGYACPF